MTTFVFKNLRQRFDNYAVARTEHDALVKSTTKIFSNFVAFSENSNFNVVLPGLYYMLKNEPYLLILAYVSLNMQEMGQIKSIVKTWKLVSISIKESIIDLTHQFNPSLGFQQSLN